MLRSIKELYDDRLGASDGEIGSVKDFYFDDQDWAIRYVIADTGTWLPGRQVLLAPHSLGRLDQGSKVLCVNLTRKQIENSPSIELHKPVSRQYEEEYYRYFGWPYYWQGEQLWGLSGTPIPTPANTPIPGSPVTIPSRADPHLRSARAVNGYHLQATDGIIGHICDFMMDAQSWSIGQFVIKTGHRLSGNEVLLHTSAVNRISYEESTVFVNLTQSEVMLGGAIPLAPVNSEA
jgi:hypothetical protein